MSKLDVAGEAVAGADGKTVAPAAAPLVPVIDLTATFGLPVAAQRRSWSLSLAAAVGAHILVLWALIPHSSEFGAGDRTELDGIDVDIVSAGSLDRNSPSDRAGGTGADAVIYGAAGAGTTAIEAATGADQPDQKRAEEKEAAPPPPTFVLNEEVSQAPRPDDIVVAPKQEPEPPKEESPKPVEAKPDTEPADAPAVAAEAVERQNVGGAAAPGQATSAQTALAGIGATPEVVTRYKRSVVEALAARKPQAKAGVRGTVRIAFTISPTGEVNTARIANSSGRSELDEAALSAVRSIKFPTPPSGLTAGELHYEIPYYFR